MAARRGSLRSSARTADLVPERVPLPGWETYGGHLRRYLWAAFRAEPGERVNDVACGIGYGSTFFPHAGSYRGWDKPGVPHGGFPGVFAEVDIDDPAWMPDECDVTCCFETLEHVKDPARLAQVISATTLRAVFVSVPVVPTMHCNEFHRHDFTAADIPPLFPRFRVAEDWYQAEETSHCWMFVRAAA